jgi:hypothetical protein
MLRQPMARRSALGSPYSKPSTAEDGLPLPANRQRFAGLLSKYSLAAQPYAMHGGGAICEIVNHQGHEESRRLLASDSSFVYLGGLGG